MADKTTLLLIAGGVGVAWYEGWLAPLGIPAPAFSSAAKAPVTPTPASASITSGTVPAASTSSAPAAPKYPPLASVRSLTLVLANADQAAKVATCGDEPPQNLPGLGPGMTLPNPAYFNWLNCRGNVQPMMSPDDWNVYLVRAGGPNPAPDPLVVFPNVDRTQPMSFDQYWPSMAAYLGVQYGMAGWRRRLR